MNSTQLLQEDTLEDEGDEAGAGTAKRARTALLDSDDEDEGVHAAPPETVKRRSVRTHCCGNSDDDLSRSLC